MKIILDKKTRDGRPVEIHKLKKEGMSIFVIFGYLDGKPCHWTPDGRYRMDGKKDPRDIVEER